MLTINNENSGTPGNKVTLSSSLQSYKKRFSPSAVVPDDDDFEQLKTASELLLRNGRGDKGSSESLDLWQQLQQNSRAQGVTQNYFIDCFNKKRVKEKQVQWQRPLESIDCRTIPRAIRNLYSQVECEMFMGLFPEISRAWITIDNRLFLWNYYKGEDFYMYDGLDQLIVSVGLARPRPGVLSDDCAFVLVISTPVEIVLLEVKFIGPIVSGEIELYPTMYNLPSDNVPMRSIVGTPEGRIFLGGHDGSLYEFIYERPGFAHSLGIKRQCRKIEVSGLGTVKWLVPTFIRGLTGKSDPLVKLVFDDQRNFLYTLTERSVLSLYTVASDGLRLVTQIDDLSKLARKFVQNPAHRTSVSGILPQHLNGRLKIVSLSVISERESHTIHVVPITSSGIRFYLSTTKAGKPGKTLELKHLRGPPNHEIAANSVDSETGVVPGPTTKDTVFNAYYSGGVTMLATSSKEETHASRLSGFATDYSMRVSTSSCELKWQWKSYHEVTDTDMLNQGPLLRDTNGIVSQGRVWDIVEESVYPGMEEEREMVNAHVLEDPYALLNTANQQLNSNGKRTISSGSTKRGVKERALGLTELTSQHLLPRRTFLVLSSTGLWSITKNRPINQLNQLLRGPDPGTNAHIEEFSRLYGLDETCAMLLAIAACTDQPDVAQRASGWYQRIGYSFGTETRLPRFDQVNANSSTAVAVMMQQTQVIHSGCFTGLQMYLARLLRPVWDWTVITSQGSCRWTPNQIRMLVEPLQQLSQCLQSLPFLQLDNKVSKRLGLPKQSATAIENAIVMDLHKLINRTIQALQVFAIVQEFGPLGKFVNAEARSKLLKMTWRDLVCSLDGKVVVSTIIKSVVESDSSLAQGLIERLSSVCPTFFSDADLLQVKALEELGKAFHLQGRPREDLMSSALENLKKGLSNAQRAKFPLVTKELKRICSVFEKLGSKRNAAALALHCAALYAEQYRENCFEITLTLLGDEQSRQQVWPVALASSLEDWHYHLYKWCLKNGLKRELLETNSPFIVPFLSDPEACTSELAAPGITHADAHLLVLCEWLSFNRRNAEAAMVLRRLATLHVAAEDKQNPNLTERLEYFNRAWIQAKAAEANSSKEVKTMKEMGFDVVKLSDEFDVCKLQMEIYRALVDENQEQSALWWTLVNVTDLYNQYAYPNELWEQCIAIIVSCDYDDTSEIQMLYRQIITQLMQGFKDEDFQDSSRWTSVIVDRIVMLGTRFHGGGARTDAFPIHFLVQELEDVHGIVCAQQNCIDWDPWVVDAMVKVGVSFQSIFDAYCYYDVHVTSDRAKIFVATALLYIVQLALKKGDSRQMDLVRTRDHLERLSVIVGGLHGDDVTQQERHRVIEDISELLRIL